MRYDVVFLFRDVPLTIELVDSLSEVPQIGDLVKFDIKYVVEELSGPYKITERLIQFGSSMKFGDSTVLLNLEIPGGVNE